MDLHFKILPRFFSQMHIIIRQMLGRKLRHFLSSDTGLLTNTLATWCEKLTHWKRPWCWERLKAGEEEDDRGWDVWMASQTQWTWVWVSSGSWWWTGKPGVLQSTGSQRVGQDWANKLNWTDWTPVFLLISFTIDWAKMLSDFLFKVLKTNTHTHTHTLSLFPTYTQQIISE